MNIYNLSQEQLEQYFINKNDKKYRAKQIYEWLYQKKVKTFDEMDNIKKEVREELKKDFTFGKIEIVSKLSDIDVYKYLFKLEDNQMVEAVVMHHDYGFSICLSTQVGCNMGCTFCESGRRKKVRNLECYEMVLPILMVEEELNVKQVIFTNEIDSYINFEIKPNFKVCGKLFGSNIKSLTEYLQNLDKETIKRLENDEVITITLNDTNYDLDKEMLDIRVNSKEGYNSGVINNSFIILNTTLTDDLINEGIARELISKVQNLRKVKDFNITDRIYIYYYADINLLEKLYKYIDFIKKETLSDSLIFEKTTDDITNLNGIDVYLDVKRV